MQSRVKKQQYPFKGKVNTTQYFYWLLISGSTLKKMERNLKEEIRLQLCNMT
jgi:hypothetical protein